MATIGERIKTARMLANLTQNELGEKVGVSGVAIMRYEKDLRTPKLQLLENLSKELNVPVGYLMGFEDLSEEFFWGKEASDETYSKIAENIERFHGAKAKMNTAFDRLNEAGQQKAVERVEELTEIPKYQKEPDEG